MNAQEVKQIIDQWMVPTPNGAYMAGLEKRPVIARAEGVNVIDTNGKSYLDFGSGQMAAALGHNHPIYVEAVTRSLTTISHSTKTFLNVDRLELHRRLGEILTKPLQKTLFLVSGSDAVEAAVDMARKVTGGVDVLGLHMGLHGSTSFVSRSLSFGWSRSKHNLAAQATSSILAPYTYRCPVGDNCSCAKGTHYQCLKTSFELAASNFTGKPAAVIMEPVLSAGGIIVPPPGYVKALRELCDQYGMLLIMDESQTGLGKTGQMWGHQHEDIVPDIMTVSKHFGAGLPISAVCTTAAIADKAAANGYFATRSHACDPITCAAGIASLDIIEKDGLVERAAQIGERMASLLGTMQDEFEFIGDVRGRGVLYGVELVQDRATKEPANAMARRVVEICQDNGLILQARGSHGRMNVIRLVPPMVCTDAQIDDGMSILRNALRTAAQS
ncbi:aspartate aminotransferase family protein [Burkholderia sp. WAC0059]|uniref:aspartate aminotransferase family protein n=1 Tax=Burkholderia sp. WAC0059 TaxID=2066022 RepID=UPI000C7F2ED9|nr:aspartate aminotransferase family protein [Burkholderia sp. WAC0059]PLZ02393.1 aspartate aminotransferase family protein [Burkholderia sp. WAC0059]